MNLEINLVRKLYNSSNVKNGIDELSVLTVAFGVENEIHSGLSDWALIKEFLGLAVGIPHFVIGLFSGIPLSLSLSLI